jgi:hypothetical protein
MASFYNPIFKYTVGSGGISAINIFNIPPVYDDLLIYVSSRSNVGGAYEPIAFAFNQNTNSIYSSTSIGSDGTNLNSARINPSGYISYTANLSAQGNTAASNFFGAYSLYIPNYSTTLKKQILIDAITENNIRSAAIGIGAGLFNLTDAVNGFRMIPYTGSLMLQNSTVSIYGISRSKITPKAIGGQVSEDSQYYYHVFTGSGTFTPTQNITADVLVVAGGGGGGGSAQFWAGGGGGAGGVLAHASQALTPTNYTVTIGAGGSGNTTSNIDNSTSGTNSQFGSLSQSFFGSRGGTLNGPGGSGTCGSSGGNIGNFTTGWWNPTTGQGFRGGFSSFAGGGHSAGGGGGAGAIGANAVQDQSGGAGGAGVNTYTNWGSLTAVLSTTGIGLNGFIAGGGGGGGSPAYGTVTQALGGSGGGGNGATVGTTNITNGLANSGSGGGGAAGTHPSAAPPWGVGANGGSGVVIVRYAK